MDKLMINDKKETTAIALFSGGLDSILACRLIAAQGIKVVAVKFVTPFFDYKVLESKDDYIAEVQKKYGINVVVKNLSDNYLNLLHNPSHGFGKNFNPCIDCKILMLKRAIEMMEEYAASFIITGEVIGQRPMSQRRDTLRVIERDSGTDKFLLRPLCAKLMKETKAEQDGLVDRSKLLDFSGRGRSRQIALAKEFGIEDFPTPAGGCILADPILSKRIEKIYAGNFIIAPMEITVRDIRLLLNGRQFLLPAGGWLILGRDMKENELLESLAQKDDALITMISRPGPVALLWRAEEFYKNDDDRTVDIKCAASVTMKYAKKNNGKACAGEVQIEQNAVKESLTIAPASDENVENWMIKWE